MAQSILCQQSRRTLKQERENVWMANRKGGAGGRTGRAVYVHASIWVVQEDTPSQAQDCPGTIWLNQETEISLSVEMWHELRTMQCRRLRRGCEAIEVGEGWKPENCFHQLYSLLHFFLSISSFLPSFLPFFFYCFHLPKYLMVVRKINNLTLLELVTKIYQFITCCKFFSYI